MAAWQYTFYILPKKDFTSKYGNDCAYLDEDFLESHDGWFSFPKVEIFAILGEHFGTQKRLSYGPKIWGNDDSNCVKFVFDKDILKDVTIRLDLRNPIKVHLDSAIYICHLLDGIMVNSDRFIIGESAEALINDIKSSKSFKFVTNPLTFLEEIVASKRMNKGED